MKFRLPLMFLFMMMSLSLGFPQPGESITWTFTKIADSNTPLPGGMGNFAILDTTPSIEGGSVAFRNRDASGQEGIYIGDGNSLTVTVAPNTPIPGGSGNFFRFSSLSLNGGNVAFVGKDSGLPAKFMRNIPFSVGISRSND